MRMISVKEQESHSQSSMGSLGVMQNGGWKRRRERRERLHLNIRCDDPDGDVVEQLLYLTALSKMSGKPMDYVHDKGPAILPNWRRER